MNSVRVKCLLVAAIAASALGYGDRLVSVDVRVELKPGAATLATMSALAAGSGRVVETDSNGCVIRLKTPVGLKTQLARLGKRGSVLSVTPVEPILPGENLLSQPLSKLKQSVEEYKESYVAWADVAGVSLKKTPSGDVKVPGTGYLEAYLQWKHDRAFPNEEIDISGYVEIANRRTFERAQTIRAQGSRAKGLPGQSDFVGISKILRGLQATFDVTGQWEFMGPNDLQTPYRTYFGLSPINGRANDVVIDPSDSNTFYTGGAMGGVWKSTDAGVNWSSTTDGWPLLGVSSLAVHPTNSNIVLAGTGDFYGSDVAGIGVMRSTDAGQTWTRTGLNMGSSMVPGLVFDPANPQIVYAVTGRAGGTARGVYRSADAGQTWTEVVTADADWSYVTIGAPGVGGARLKWAVAGGSSPQIRTSLNGTTWTTVTNPTTGNQNPFHIAASKIDPNTAYLLATSPRKIYKTVDGGVSWTDSTAGFPNGTSPTSTYNWSQGWYDYYIKTSVVNGQDMVFVGLIDVVMSIDGGASWRNIGGTNFTAAYTGSAIVHQDNHNLTIDPNNPLRALVATDGGVFLFNYNAGNDTYTWGRLNKNLGITQFYTLAVHPTNPDYVKGGTQDNSTPHSFGNLIQWGNPGAGDGAGCAINQTNPLIQYNSSQFHGLERTTNAYATSSGFKPSFGSDSVPFIGRLWLDPNDQTNVYVNTNYLWRYKEGTGTWTPRLGGQLLASSGQVRALGIAPGDGNVMYTGASNGDMYMTRDFGATWTRLDATIGFPNTSILDISVNPGDKNDILIATGSNRLYRLTGTNNPSPTLTSVNGSGSNSIPSVAVNTIARDPWQPATRWYVGTDVGVFTTDNSGASYTDITQSRGLPNVQVNQLIANKTTGYMTAATYGRGIWRIEIIPAVLQSLSASPSSVMSGDSGNLTVTLDRVAPSGGVTVALTDNSPNLQIPSTATIPAGAASVVVPYTSNEVSTGEAVVISGEFGQIRTATVNLIATTNLSLNRFSLSNAAGTAGSLGSLAGSDDSRLSWNIQRPSSLVTTLFGRVRIPTANAQQVRVEVEARASVGDLSYQILAYNLNSNIYQVIGSGTMPTSDANLIADISNPSAYYNVATEMQIAFAVSSGSPAAFNTAVDRVRVRVIP